MTEAITQNTARTVRPELNPYPVSKLIDFRPGQFYMVTFKGMWNCVLTEMYNTGFIIVEVDIVDGAFRTTAAWRKKPNVKPETEDTRET